MRRRTKQLLELLWSGFLIIICRPGIFSWIHNILQASHPPSKDGPTPHLTVVKALGEKEDLSNLGGIRHHHGNGPEHGFEIIWEFRSASIP